MKKILINYLIIGLTGALIATAVVVPTTILLAKNSQSKEENYFTKKEIEEYEKESKENNEKYLNFIKLNPTSDENSRVTLDFNGYISLTSDSSSSLLFNDIKQQIDTTLRHVAYKWYKFYTVFLEKNSYEPKNLNEWELIYDVDYLYAKGTNLYIHEISVFYAKKVKKAFGYGIIAYEATRATRKDVHIYANLTQNY